MTMATSGFSPLVAFLISISSVSSWIEQLRHYFLEFIRFVLLGLRRREGVGGLDRNLGGFAQPLDGGF